MLEGKGFSFGKLNGIVYDFVEVNDVLEMHQHDEATIHITIVARGSFKIHGNEWERTVTAGDVIDWRPHDPHEFIALEANSRIVNINKGLG
jgi:quercetin dioxygenase-like cupin family protein